MLRTRIVSTLCAMVICFAGCSQNKEATSTGAATQPLPKATAEADVITKADQLLKSKGLKWGNSIEVRWQEEHNRHLVLYSTPQEEKAMVGDRGVFVFRNGTAAVMPQL